MPESWERIGDDDFAGFGRKQFVARRMDTESDYLVVVDDLDQGRIRLSVGDEELEMDIQVKEVSSDGIYRLSGGLSDPGDALGIERYAWAEIELTPLAVISYWGNGVVLRQDSEVQTLGELAVR